MNLENVELDLNKMNKNSPSWIEWAVAIFLFALLFLSFGYGDAIAIIRYQIDFADTILHGEFKNFFGIAQEKAVFAQEHGLDMTHGFMPCYDSPVNFVLGIWGIPLYLYFKYSGTEYTANFAQIVYGKSLFLIAFIGTVILVYKILRAFKLDRGRAKLGAFLYFTSTMALVNIGIMGQLDALGVFFTLLCVFNYIKINKWAFIWFIAAFPFKQLVTFIYLPLLLMRDKNLFKNAAKIAAALIFKLIYDIPEKSADILRAYKSNFLLEIYYGL